jgi:hypothetical protein
LLPQPKRSLMVATTRGGSSSSRTCFVTCNTAGARHRRGGLGC